MKELLTYLSFIYLTVFLSVIVNAQSGVDWLLQSKTDGVELYYKVINCNDQEVVILKFVNTNNFDVIVLWDNELLFENDFKYRSNLEKNTEAKNSTFIKAGETTNAQCNQPMDSKLIIHYKNKVSFPPDAKMIQFKPYNFSVSQQIIND